MNNFHVLPMLYDKNILKQKDYWTQPNNYAQKHPQQAHDKFIKKREDDKARAQRSENLLLQEVGGYAMLSTLFET
jgi:hypothetical protein